VGGIGTLVGPIVGEAAIIAMHHFTVGVREWLVTIQGLIFFVTVLLFRRGIVGEIKEPATCRRKGEANQVSRQRGKSECQARTGPHRHAMDDEFWILQEPRSNDPGVGASAGFIPVIHF
jgi:hypothetical protein